MHGYVCSFGLRMSANRGFNDNTGRNGNSNNRLCGQCDACNSSYYSIDPGLLLFSTAPFSFVWSGLFFALLFPFAECFYSTFLLFLTPPCIVHNPSFSTIRPFCFPFTLFSRSTLTLAHCMYQSSTHTHTQFG